MCDVLNLFKKVNMSQMSLLFSLKYVLSWWDAAVVISAIQYTDVFEYIDDAWRYLFVLGGPLLYSSVYYTSVTNSQAK